MSEMKETGELAQSASDSDDMPAAAQDSTAADQKNQAKTEIFRDAPIAKAVFSNAVPAMLAMIMVLVYNLADTFFIGQTGDALQVAAVSVATPVFMIFMTLGTMFGIGGTSLISRSLGAGRDEYARHVSALCFWGCIVSGLALLAVMLIFMEPILYAIGANEGTYALAESYLRIVCYSGPLVILGNCFSNILRAEGQSTKGMVGMVLGNVVNVVLDPLFILGFGMGITGAAVATVIGNVCAAVYYLAYLLGGKSALSIKLRDVRVRDHVLSGVMAIGIPAAIGDLLMSISTIVVNALIAGYGDNMAVAGIGVAMKVTMITGCLCIGLGQGVQPLLGYCVGAKMEKRYHEALRFSVIFATATSTVLMVLCYVFAPQLVGAFLSDQDAYDYALTFTHIILTTSFLFGAYYVLLNAIQAMGDSTSSLIVNIARQGLVFIPAALILNSVVGLYGVVWSQPLADVLSLILTVLLYRRASKRLWSGVRESEESKAGKDHKGTQHSTKLSAGADA